MAIRKPLIFYLVGVLLMGAFVFLFGFKLNYEPFKFDYKAEKGVMDLSQEKFVTNKYAILKGEWAFYWNQLLTPNDFKNNEQTPCYIELPGVWNNYECNNIATKSQGYATYKLNIHLSEPGYYGIRIKEFDCAYKIWVNGKDSVLSGVVGKSRSQEVANWRRNELYFTTDSTEIEIVMQVSNYHHRKGGAEDAIILSKGQVIYKYKLKQIGVAYFLSGFFVIMVLHYFVMFLYRKEDKSLLLFALMNLLMNIRLGTIGEKVLLDYFQQMPWSVAIRFEYLSLALIVPVFYAFFHTLFPKYFFKIGIKLISICAALVSLMVLFLPATIFTYTPIYYQIVIALAAIYTLIALVWASIKQVENAFVVLGGYIFFFIGIVNDVLYYNNTIETSFMMPFGLFVMIFTQAFVLSKNNSDAYSQSKILSKELEEANRNLEQKVHTRTQEIENQKKEIEKKSYTLESTNNELNRLNEFLKDMTGMIVHDLKNPLSTIINIDMVKNESDRVNIVKQSGYKMLNLTQNILDVYKYDNLKIELNRERVQLVTIVRSAMNDVSFLASIKNLKFDVDIDIHSTVDVDFEIIKRVLTNLFSNAIKFSPENGVIQIITTCEKYGYYRVGIINEGPGIPKYRHHEVFRKFGQVEKRGQGSISSTGLGLTFCKMAIEAHNCEIGFISETEMGVEFWFTLPDGSPEIENEGEKTVELSVEDKVRLTENLQNLAKYELYEVSAIMRELNKIEATNSVIEKWKEKVEETIYSCNHKMYKKLINL